MATLKNKKPKNRRGGSRLGAGRKGKPIPAEWGYVTCSLKHEMIARLREGAGSIYIGEFLQKHLDRFPPPTRARYLARLARQSGGRLPVDPAVAVARAEARRARQLAELGPSDQKLVKEFQRMVKRDHTRKVVPS